MSFMNYFNTTRSQKETCPYAGKDIIKTLMTVWSNCWTCLITPLGRITAGQCEVSLIFNLMSNTIKMNTWHVTCGAYPHEDVASHANVHFPYLSSNIPESPAIWYFCFTVERLCSSLFEIRRFSVQRIYSGFCIEQSTSSKCFLHSLQSSYPRLEFCPSWFKFLPIYILEIFIKNVSYLEILK